MVAPARERPAVHRSAHRLPTRSVSATASSLEVVACTDNLAANPASADGGYTRSGGTASWTNATSIYTSNNTYATCVLGGDEKSKFLRAGGFALGALPDDAIIRGVEVRIRRYAAGDGPIQEAAVQLAREHVVNSTNRATNAAVGQTPAVATYGSATDTWGEQMATPALYKPANFGVLIGYDNTAFGVDVEGYVLVDHVELTVYFDEAPDCAGLTESSSWAGNASANSTWTNPSYAAGAPTNNDSAVAELGGAGFTEYLVLSDFSFSIPETDVIRGVQVTIVHRMTGAVTRWHYITIRYNNADVGRPKYPFIAETGSSFVYGEYGNCADFWPPPGSQTNQFTPEMFNSGEIIVGIRFENNAPSGSATAEINAVKLTVWHEAP